MAPDRQLPPARADDGLRPRQCRGRDRGRRGLSALIDHLDLVRALRTALPALVMALAFAAPVHAQVAGVVPASIDIPSIGTHAVVVPLGLDDDGALQAPTDPDTVGWYGLGTGIGAPGNALLDGHVDWAGQLRAFGFLGHLGPGDTILITDTNGNVLSYSVNWTMLYDADTAPVTQIFQQSSAEEVTLITCGGAFDHAVHMYVSRWVVRATRFDPSAD